MRATGLIAGVVVLAVVWFGPLPDLARESFAAHMTLHMAVVAVAAPLLALALSGTAGDPARASPRLLAPIPLSLVELVVVWVWHAPALHHAARREAWAFVVEQASFMTAGLLLWLAVLGGGPVQRRARGGAGVVALLFTSMHMTLLGALFALANRPLFEHAPSAAGLPLSPLTDQHLGGVIMLLVGGASYLVGGLGLTAVVLRPGTPLAAGREERTT
jgi:putative membrane protein